MEKKELKKLIDVSAGREQADFVIKNVKIVDVYNHSIIEGKDIAVTNGLIAGIGEYDCNTIVDAEGAYVAPGFIDSHIHIESSYVTPEEIGRLLIPHGGTTIIADPHEIVNVAGIEGLNYMLKASENGKLDIKYMLPSCVPATPWENAGAKINAAEMKEPIKNESILGLGEFMDFPGVINANDDVLEKLLVAKKENKLIDGHSPGLTGNSLNAYVAAGIHDEHECETVQDAEERISKGMYVMLREGSACRNLRAIIKAVTPMNSRRFILCSDDRQPKTILSVGHLDNHLRMCVEEGLDPVTAIQMASLNAAECFKLYDRGAIAPGLRADLVFLEDLKAFKVKKVFIKGEKVAENGNYLFSVKREDASAVKGRFNVKDFSIEKLKMHLKSNRVKTIDILPGGVVTGSGIAEVKLDGEGNFIFEASQDVVKVAVVERHIGTGNVSLGFIRNYGIKNGAIAISIAHDSHNIIVVGTNDFDMCKAVENLIEQGGGIVLVDKGKVVNSMPFVIGGIMTDKSGEWVSEHLTKIHEDAHNILEVSRTVEPVMTLCFMSLAVIPELKITDVGLFDVKKFDFTSIEAEN